MSYIYFVVFLAIKQPELANPPPPLLLTRPTGTPYTTPVPPTPSYSPNITSVMRANWFTRFREPVKYTHLVKFAMEHERITIKILRYIVEWAKSLPFFMDLCQNDKQSMLEASWLEIFLLVVTQYRLLPDLAKFLMLLKGRNVDKTVRQIEAEVIRCRALNCDEIEMDCLKAIVLYNAGEMKLKSVGNSSCIRNK